MRKLNGRALILSAAAFLWTSLLTGCTPPPPVITADTGCTAFKRITTTPDQDAAAKLAPNIWFGLYLQIEEHDSAYLKRCS